MTKLIVNCFIKRMILLSVLCSAACVVSSGTQVVDLSNYLQFRPKVLHTNVHLLQLFYLNEECKDGMIYSNVYKCLLDTGDTLFVFDYCQSKMPEYLRNDFEYKADLYLIVDIKDVQVDFQKTVHVPRSVKLGEQSLFIVAKLKRLVY